MQALDNFSIISYEKPKIMIKAARQIEEKIYFVKKMGQRNAISLTLYKNISTESELIA